MRIVSATGSISLERLHADRVPAKGRQVNATTRFPAHAYAVGIHGVNRLIMLLFLAESTFEADRAPSCLSRSRCAFFNCLRSVHSR